MYVVDQQEEFDTKFESSNIYLKSNLTEKEILKNKV